MIRGRLPPIRCGFTPCNPGAKGVWSAAPEEVVRPMCWGPEESWERSDAQEEIRLLFERYRRPEPPVERFDDDEEDAPEPERVYTLTSAT